MVAAATTMAVMEAARAVWVRAAKARAVVTEAMTVVARVKVAVGKAAETTASRVIVMVEVVAMGLARAAAEARVVAMAVARAVVRVAAVRCVCLTVMAADLVSMSTRRQLQHARDSKPDA